MENKAEERGIEKGIEKGINIGVEKEASEKALRVAAKMLRRGDSIEDIIDIAEISKEKVMELKKKMMN